jgi:hypothetical protein
MKKIFIGLLCLVFSLNVFADFGIDKQAHLLGGAYTAEWLVARGSNYPTAFFVVGFLSYLKENIDPEFSNEDFFASLSGVAFAWIVSETWKWLINEPN